MANDRVRFQKASDGGIIDVWVAQGENANSNIGFIDANGVFYHSKIVGIGLSPFELNTIATRGALVARTMADAMNQLTADPE